MQDLSTWTYHYDTQENGQPMRSNLVYTALINPERTQMCMEFIRHPEYHNKDVENERWTDSMLEERFRREIKFHTLAKSLGIPTLDILDIDYPNRRIFIEWFDNDFYSLGQRAGSYDKLLPGWDEQWLNIMSTLWNNNMYKISLHPNSFAIKNNKLVAFNWFFTFNGDEQPLTLKELSAQISTERMDKLQPVMDMYDVTVDTLIPVATLQAIALTVFKSNYPHNLMDNAKTLLDESLESKYLDPESL